MPGHVGDVAYFVRRVVYLVEWRGNALDVLVAVFPVKVDVVGCIPQPAHLVVLVRATVRRRVVVPLKDHPYLVRSDAVDLGLVSCLGQSCSRLSLEIKPGHEGVVGAPELSRIADRRGHLALKEGGDVLSGLVVGLRAADGGPEEAERVGGMVVWWVNREHLACCGRGCEEGEDRPRPSKGFGDVGFGVGKVAEVVRRVGIIVALGAVGDGQIWDALVQHDLVDILIYEQGAGCKKGGQG